MGRLVYGQDERVSQWVAAQNGEPPPPVVSAIGWERDGELTAGIYFDTMNSNNLFVHIASTGRIVPVEMLAAGFAYAYRQLGLDRLTFMIEDSNKPCIDFVESMGATLEGRLRGAAKSGDVLLYVAWKTNRFWVKLCETGRS